MSSPPVPDAVARAFSTYEAPVRRRLLEVRELIFAVAAETESVGPLTEALRWGEPAYLTEAGRSGSTIRLGVVRTIPDSCAALFNCHTTLVDTFRTQFANDLRFDGNRAVILPLSGPLPVAPLAFCLRAALTYHRRNGGRMARKLRSNLDGHF